ncbi:hypothetical protein Leryth_024163 [Lithospermum erythrorhizon]|nr:hypothetical protein Leryth_024163 [Lithospermum erythrorhizon]
MASSKLTFSVSSDLRQESPPFPTNNYPLQTDSNNSSDSSINLDGILQNSSSEASFLNTEIGLLDEAGAIMPIHEAPERKRTVDEVWREIVEGKVGESKRKLVPECKTESMDEVMTLEDFLVQAGAVDETEIGGEVKLESGVDRLSGGVYTFDSPGMMAGQLSLQSGGESGRMYLGGSNSGMSLDGIMGYEDGVELMGGSGRIARGKIKVSMLENSLDKAAQQRQRRMIKNRESAARSRERKQAYQVELESMAVRLEEENEILVKAKAERMKERLEQLMKNVIPVVEKRRPTRVLRRVRSMGL